MTQNQLIAVAAFVVPCATALLVGYWHRKQMRQVELFRQDPSVGVLPAPSPPVAFIKRYRDLVVGAGTPVLSLVILVARHGPATNLSAALISFNFACIVYNSHLHSEMRVLHYIFDLLDFHKKTTDVLFEQMKLTEVIVNGRESQ